MEGSSAGLSHGKRAFTSLGRAAYLIPPYSAVICAAMRTLLAALSAAVLSLLADASGPGPAGQVGVPQVEQYFNSIRTLKARFVQSNPNGSVVQGTLYVRRPGRMRFEYDAPSQLKIVADGSQVTMWDNANARFRPVADRLDGRLVPGQGAAVAVGRPAGREARAGQTACWTLTMSQARKPQEGKVIVRLGGKSDAAARLDHHRQPRQPGRPSRCRTCRPACSWPIRCSSTTAADCRPIWRGGNCAHT